MHHRNKALWTSNRPQEGQAGEMRRKVPSISHHSVEPLSIRLYNSCCGRFTRCIEPGPHVTPPLYTAEERRRRDASPWTLVQGVLAPVQFAVFLVSLCLVLRYLATGEGLAARDRVDRGQDLPALRHHDHRLDLGARSLRPLSVRAGLLLGGRVQHARAGAAHRLPRRLWSRELSPYASRCCSRSPPTPPTSSTRRSSCSSCAPRVADAAGRASAWRSLCDERARQTLCSGGRAGLRRSAACCASAASARCSAA